jgi:hypothetical protein
MIDLGYSDIRTIRGAVALAKKFVGKDWKSKVNRILE